MLANAAGGAAFIFILIFIGIYFIPTIVAITRKVTNTGSVFVINFLLGWTLIGWAVALAMAVKTNMTQVHVVTSTSETLPRPTTSTMGAVRPPAPRPATTIQSNVESSNDSNEEAVNWCDHCNAEVRSGAKFCPSCGSKTNEVNIFACVECNEPIALDDKFCPSCGSSVD
jgi:RNA polymerase subunit RPABC4/transcription elongation factor Spt4